MEFEGIAKCEVGKNQRRNLKITERLKSPNFF